ncbi:MAG: cytochrome c biogenesis protein [Candidatus Neomarinimicrobiota bacterium]
MNFLNKKINLTYAIVSFLLSCIHIYIVLTLKPLNISQGIFGNIFYVHVPIAWTAFILYFFVMISSVFYLINKKNIWDNRAYAFAEVGTIFMALVLITGPIWAKPAWGYFWPWEPRLTTSLVLFIIYIGYFMLREFGGNLEQTSKYSSVLGIIAFLNVPLIFISVKFWLPEMQSHPQVGQYFDTSNPIPKYLIIFSFITFLFTSSLMVRYRIHLLKIIRS